MNKKHQKTLDLIFKLPIQSNVRWSDIESLFTALDCNISEGRGSRVQVKLNGERAVFHRPHPKPEIDKGALNSVKRFLINAGIKNDEI